MLGSIILSARLYILPVLGSQSLQDNADLVAAAGSGCATVITAVIGRGRIAAAALDKFLEEDGSLKTGGMAEKATAAYHKVEDTVVGGYKKVENAFVDAFLEKVDEPESKDFEEKK